MKTSEKPQKEETLDPDDWQAMKSLGRQVVDEIFDYLESVRERPVWQPVPKSIRAQFKQPIPLAPQKPENIYQDFVDYVLPYPMGNIHPRFWGWVIGTGTPFGALAEMLAAAMNDNAGGSEDISCQVESQVIEWCKEMLGYPQDASGLLVSGGSMANLVGLAVARNTMAGFDLRKDGLQNVEQKLMVYCSVETHSSVQRAVEVLGLGHAALRKIPVNGEFRIDLKALKEAITIDRAEGLRPICVVGNAGTTNTGAFDNLRELATICEWKKLWLHIDGAFGAFAALSPAHEHLVKGMERADSLAFDLHKWMYMPYEVGCVLVRDRFAHRNTFALTPDYLAHEKRGLAAGENWFSDFGIELSRGFRALKVWMSLKEHGLQKYARLIQQNIDQARYLADLIEFAPELELLAPVPLNVVCFRFKVGQLKRSALNALNKEIVLRLQETGIAVPSSTLLDGDYAIRIAIVNHRSKREDFDVLVQETIRIGKEICGVG